jgi:hypothetical protein
MEPKVPVSFSQEPVTKAYHEPVETNSKRHIYFYEINFNSLPSTLMSPK